MITPKAQLTTLLLLLICSSCAGSPVASSAHHHQDDEAADAKKFAALAEWVRTNGGRVDNRLALTYNENGIRGGVAIKDIPADTELLFLPWNVILGTEGDTHQVVMSHCDSMFAYADEIRAGKDSFWYPYLSMDDSLGSRIPTIWHESIRHEFQQRLAPSLQESMESSLVDWYSSSCVDNVPYKDLDEASHRSLLAAISRAVQRRFLPIYDLLNHDNGKLNTRLNGDREGCFVHSSVTILEQSEIFVSYRGGKSTSSDIFQRYGFIEPYPQQWAWTNKDSIEERFLLLPHGVVALLPLDSLTKEIGTAAEPLSDLAIAAKEHNQRLTPTDLRRFIDSAKNLLTSFNTTVSQDADMLAMLEHRLSLESQGIEEVANITDWKSAVEYHKQFKDAIQVAVGVAEIALADRMSEL